MAIVIKSAAKVREEERLLTEAQKLCAKKPRTDDRSDYESWLSKFKSVALEIRELLKTKFSDTILTHYPELENFRGAWEEVPLLFSFINGDPDNPDIQKLIRLLQQLQHYDQAFSYEAEKLNILNPQPFLEAWADEISPN